MVCHCLGVNDRRLRREVAAGALTAEQIAARCGAGTRCGGCRQTVEELLLEIRGVAASAA